MRGRANIIEAFFASIAEFFNRLSVGDPVAIGIVIGAVVFLALAFVVIWIVGRRLRADDEARAKKYGRTLKPKKK